MLEQSIRPLKVRTLSKFLFAKTALPSFEKTEILFQVRNHKILRRRHPRYNQQLQMA